MCMIAYYGLVVLDILRSSNYNLLLHEDINGEVGLFVQYCMVLVAHFFINDLRLKFNRAHST